MHLSAAQLPEAELTKIAINGMLATRVSFMNELSELASQRGIDIETVRQGIGSDGRIGHQYLYPGCGFGGEAFLQTLDQLADELQDRTGFGLLCSVRAINDQQKDLLNFIRRMRYWPSQIRLVHGQDGARQTLKQQIEWFSCFRFLFFTCYTRSLYSFLKMRT